MTFHFEGWAALLFLLGIIFVFLGGPFFVIVVILSRIRQKAEVHARKRAATIVAQYDPPSDMRPAKLGFLYDTNADEREYWATLLDLKQRNIISITDGGIFMTNHAPQTLNRYESTLIDALGAQNSLKNSVSNAPQDFYKYIRETVQTLSKSFARTRFQNELRLTLVEKGYLKGTSAMIFWYIAGTILLSFLLNSWVLSTMAMPLNVDNGSSSYVSPPFSAINIFTAIFLWLIFSLIFFPFSLPFVFIAMKIIKKHGGMYLLGTKKLRAVWPEIEGYRLFLKQTDLDNIQFEATSGQRSFPETLPYVIALNLINDWQKYIR
jgi:hypothetical protein